MEIPCINKVILSYLNLKYHIRLCREVAGCGGDYCIRCPGMLASTTAANLLITIRLGTQGINWKT